MGRGKEWEREGPRTERGKYEEKGDSDNKRRAEERPGG